MDAGVLINQRRTAYRRRLIAVINAIPDGRVAGFRRALDVGKEPFGNLPCCGRFVGRSVGRGVNYIGSSFFVKGQFSV
jgi:hypothetical protein